MDISSKIHDTLGPKDAAVRILLINPNSTRSFTKEVCDYLQTALPGDIQIDFYTAPSPAPPSIDGTEDGIASTQVIVSDLSLENTKSIQVLIESYTSIIVACFSMHPLVGTLRTALAGRMDKTPTVLGIMESAIMAAMSLGGKFGIATTGEQWEALFDQGTQQLGISTSRYAGTKGTGFNAISLHGDGPTAALLQASEELVKKGADVIVLGCGGMAPMRSSLEDSLAGKVGRRVPVVDGVQAAVDMAIGFGRASKLS
ncbi:hypothetical protein IAU60_003397 [Kwoniella sp. DSM 27419]